MYRCAKCSADGTGHEINISRIFAQQISSNFGSYCFGESLSWQVKFILRRNELCSSQGYPKSTDTISFLTGLHSSSGQNNSRDVDDLLEIGMCKNP